jgi:hypothetical protein
MLCRSAPVVAPADCFHSISGWLSAAFPAEAALKLPQAVSPVPWSPLAPFPDCSCHCAVGSPRRAAGLPAPGAAELVEERYAALPVAVGGGCARFGGCLFAHTQLCPTGPLTVHW